MVSANVFRVPIKADSGRSRERHERTTRINYFDVDYGDAVPGCHVPVAGLYFRLHASGATKQVGWYCCIPGKTGPPGVITWYPGGDGSGVGSATAVPDVTTMAATAAAAMTSSMPLALMAPS
jgi:hypothetical protein